jgi:glycosyltransferase involved in cell wall biosynthesis
MKIIFFTENRYCGGMDSFLITLINNWPDQRDELTIVGNQDHPGLDVIEQRLSRKCRIVRHQLPMYYNLLQKIKRYEKFGLILKVLLPLQYVLFVYYIFALRRILLADMPDRLMVIAGNYPGGDTCRAAVISWALFTKRPKAIFNFHNMVIVTPWGKKWIEFFIDRLVGSCSSQLITVSNAAVQSMQNRPAMARMNKTFYIYNGIDAPKYDSANREKTLKEELGLDAGSKLCLMMGTYEERKGHKFLLRSFQKVVNKIPNAHLIICGHGFPEEIEAVRKVVDQLDMTRHVHLFGFRDDVSSLVHGADVLLVSSHAFESFGLTCVEAMAHRVPVVATQVGGLPEVVHNGEGGYCLPPDDVEGYAVQIVRLLEDEGLRKEQGEKGYQRYRRMFTGERMAKEYEQVIHGENKLKEGEL